MTPISGQPISARRIRPLAVAGFAVSLGLGLMLVTSSAEALTINNQDAVARKLAVIKGKTSTPLNVVPKQKVTVDCDGGCSVKLVSGGDEYDFKGPETISIQDNVIYTDVDPTGGE